MAPFQIHLLGLGNDENVKKKAEELYQTLTIKGFEVLYDDREESAGTKLNDADLIGMPLRILVSKKTLEKQAIEWKERNSAESSIVTLDELVQKIADFLKKS